MNGEFRIACLKIALQRAFLGRAILIFTLVGPISVHFRRSITYTGASGGTKAIFVSMLLARPIGLLQQTMFESLEGSKLAFSFLVALACLKLLLKIKLLLNVFKIWSPNA